MKDYRLKSRSASSMVYLGLSMIVFAISFGIIFYLLPMILGTFFSIMPPVMNASWQATNVRTQAVIQFLIPLMPSLGIFIFVLKVLMAATTRGGNG